MFPSYRSMTIIALLAVLPAAAHAQASMAGRPACDSAAACPRPAAGMGAMGMGSMNMDMGMKMMEAGDARLDSLVSQMHAATGPAKTGAMERVIDELLAQRKTMREHMMTMMHSAMPTPGVGELGHEEHH